MRPGRCNCADMAHTCAAQTIVALLWGERTQAKQNLRTVLPDLRRLLGDHVRIERQTVAFDRTSPYWLDVAVLRRDLDPSRSPPDLAHPVGSRFQARQAAVDLYQREFLHGFYVRDAPVFEAWVLEQREQIHALVVNALTVLVGEYAQRGDDAAMKRMGNSFATWPRANTAVVYCSPAVNAPQT